MHSWNTKRSSQTLSQAKQASLVRTSEITPSKPSLGESSSKASASADSEGWILDFGTSVNVNEDLRHAIRKEIDEIEQATKKIEGATEEEQRTAEQLGKDLSHAHSEMKDLARTAADQLENATVNEQVRLRLQEALHQRTVSQSREHVEDQDFQNRSGDPEVEAKDAAPSTCKIQSTKGFVTQYQAELRQITESTRQEVDEIKKKRTRIKSLEDSVFRIEETIKEEKLEQQIESRKQESVARKQEAEAETAHLNAVESKLHDARSRCGEFAQQIADFTKKLNDTRTAHAAKEADVQKSLVQVQEESEKAKAIRKELEYEIRAVKDQNENMEKQISTLEQAQQSLFSKEKETDALEDDIERMKKIQAEMEEKLLASKKNKEEAEKELAAAKASHAEAEAKKMANDELEATKCLPAMSELESQLKLKELVASMITSVHQSLSDTKGQHILALQKPNVELQQLEHKRDQLKQEAEEKVSELDQIKNEMKASSEAFEKEVNQLEDMSKKLSEAASAENDRTHKNRKDLDTKKHLALEKKREREEAQQRYLVILRHGAKLLKENERELRKIRSETLA